MSDIVNDERVEYVYSDGSPVPANYCVVPSNYITSFTISVRSLSPVQAERIVQIIENRFAEVVSIERTGCKCVVRGTPPMKV